MSGPTAHALFSASGAPAWMRCAPKLAAERGMPDSSSEYADEGTAAHTLAALVLETHSAKIPGALRAEDWINDTITAGERKFVVDDDMAGHVQTYVDNVLARIEAFKLRGAVSVELLVEVRVDYSVFLGVADSFGTSDVVLLVEWPGDVWQIDVDDLKYGMGVKVYAEHNEQMMLYALGAYDQFSAIVGNVEIVSMAIHQPRVQHLDEWECSLDDLLAFAEEARAAASVAEAFFTEPAALDDYTPGEKQCRFCKVRGTCRALAQHVIDVVSGDFEAIVEMADVLNVEPVAAKTEAAKTEAVQNAVLAGTLALKVADQQHLDALFPSLGLIDAWLGGVRQAIEHAALAGAVFENCKLVRGKRGNRAWTDEAEAERRFKGMRLKTDQMYKFKLISPTDAEKLLKEQPKRWNKLQALIGQAEGGLSVAPISDKRPAIVVQPVANDFEEVVEAPPEDDCSDLA